MNKCVYIHKLDGEIVYIGSGSKLRVKSSTRSCKEHVDAWGRIEFEIVKDGISQKEALELEQSLIDKHMPSGKLFNIAQTVCKVHELNYEELHSVLYYDETSPTCLRWKKSTNLNIKIGDVAGNISRNGYCVIGFKEKLYRAHRIIWVLNTGVDIKSGMVIDHIDCDKSNNRLCNLRMVSSSENNKNRQHPRSNTGFQGIYERPSGERFVLQFKTANNIRESINFSYKINSVRPAKNHYPTRELAFEAALSYRNSLIDRGLIQLTNLDEPDTLPPLVTT
jgi:HNH endonuclease